MTVRNGTDRDAEELSKCFKNLGFEVVIHNDQTCDEMTEILEKGECYRQTTDCCLWFNDIDTYQACTSLMTTNTHSVATHCDTFFSKLFSIYRLKYFFKALIYDLNCSRSLLVVSDLESQTFLFPHLVCVCVCISVKGGPH